MVQTFGSNFSGSLTSSGCSLATFFLGDCDCLVGLKVLSGDFFGALVGVLGGVLLGTFLG